MPHTALVVRLSSLGDVVLASSVLEVDFPHSSIDWLTSAEYTELFENHPRIRRVFSFYRKNHSKNWRRLCRKLWELRYDTVFDLHGSLRTRQMKLFFYYWALCEGVRPPQWVAPSKQKHRLYGYFIFKKYWPKQWRPTPWITRYTQCVGGRGLERPVLRHLLQPELSSIVTSLLQAAAGRPVLCVMPSSRWSGKKWPVRFYFELLQKLPYFPVILGTLQDQESVELVTLLEAAQLSYASGVGKLNLTQTASLLHHSAAYLGGDTGLSHLAEAMGTPAHVIFGPTMPDMGFGPWQEKSQSLGIPLGCRPCGSDGRYCYRWAQKHHCLKAFQPEALLKYLEL